MLLMFIGCLRRKSIYYLKSDTFEVVGAVENAYKGKGYEKIMDLSIFKIEQKGERKMDLLEEINRYPGIADKVNKLGKVKGNLLNKKLMAEAVELWQRFTPEELSQLDKEIGNAEILMKAAIITPTAVCYYSMGVFFAIPVRDVMWVYPRIVKESMYFIPTGKIHQIFLMERNGEQHIICQLSTGAFNKITPANDGIDFIRKVLDPVRKGIVYGYSKEINNWFYGNLKAATAKVDADSAN